MRSAVRRRLAVAVSVVGVAAATVVVLPTVTSVVDTDMAINTTAIDFGQVNVGSSGGQASVTLTNTGGGSFGPINIFGGAPPTAEFNASQNCQGTTLPAGGSCMVNYTFSPGSAGTFNDTSSLHDQPDQQPERRRGLQRQPDGRRLRPERHDHHRVHDHDVHLHHHVDDVDDFAGDHRAQHHRATLGRWLRPRLPRRHPR